MKKSNIELILDTLDDINNHTSRLDYNTSTYINRQIIKIKPILEAELDRLSSDKIDINSPRLLVLGTRDINTEQSLVEFANTKMAELVENNYKIIDFGLYNNHSTTDMYVYIKYTN